MRKPTRKFWKITLIVLGSIGLLSGLVKTRGFVSS